MLRSPSRSSAGRASHPAHDSARATGGAGESGPTRGAVRAADVEAERANGLTRITRGWARLSKGLRRAILGGAAAVVVVVIALLAFGPLVRARVGKEAERRNLEITVGAVRPGFFAIGLRDLHLKPRGVAGLGAHLDEVRVELTAGLSVREVIAHGGAVEIDGEPEDVVQRIKDLRRTGEGGAASHAAHTALTVDGVSLVWKLPSGGEVSGRGLSLARSSDASTRASCTQLAAKRGATMVELSGGDVYLDASGSIKRLAAATLVLAHEPPRAASPARSNAAAGAADEAPPPLPVVSPRGGRKTKNAPKPSAAVPSVPVPESHEPILPLPDLHALRARIGAAMATLGARVPDGSKVDVGGLSVKLDVGEELVAFGPGPFTLERRGDALHLAFTSEKGAVAGGTPLSIDADLPLGVGDVTARLSGGPVSLALLGVKEGTMGLSDVGRGAVTGKGQLVLSAGGDALTFDGRIGLRSISIKQPRLAPEVLRGVDFTVAARGVLEDGGRLRVDDAELEMGALKVKTHGTIEDGKEHFAASLSLDVAPAACQALLESAPRGLLPTISAARMAGTFGATARIAFDSRAFDKLALDYQIDDRCKMIEVPRELSKERFASSFSYRTYKPDGEPSDTVTGPGTPTWTNLDEISPFMVAAVLTTEDGAFYKHHGFNHAAIKNSLAANLKARRFIRGASTITMQLTKNLFLSREKTLSRKIEEVVLTDYLEQILRKDDMMELYLNVIEFGPDVYGITQAADYYFGRKPDELNLAECIFLASLLPSPLRYGKLREKGEVPESWMRHIRTLIEIAGKNGKVTPAEAADGLAQPIAFHKPGDPRPEPRKPFTSARREPRSDDSGWQPLE